jgi:hypothetical protein
VDFSMAYAIAVFPAPGGPQSSVTLPHSKPPPRASSSTLISVYALLGGWSSSERSRNASDAETVGRRSDVCQSMARLMLLKVVLYTGKRQYMASEVRHHLRDEAGSLLTAFELDGAEE